MSENHPRRNREQEILRRPNPHRVALSLKRSVERRPGRKKRLYHSALFMLNFYIRHAELSLTEKQKDVLIRAKGELRKVFRTTRSDAV
jgi:hypothetical protein